MTRKNNQRRSYNHSQQKHRARQPLLAECGSEAGSLRFSNFDLELSNASGAPTDGERGAAAAALGKNKSWRELFSMFAAPK